MHKDFIKNNFGDVLGLKYKDTELSQIDPVQTAKETGTYGVVVIENSNCSPKEFAEWSLEYGYHLSPDIWCTDDEHSDLFWRVTNEKVDENNQGLFADYELDWHTNVTPVGDAEEVVGLFAKTITYDTETWFCNSIPYWKNLSNETKNYYETLKIILDPSRRLGRIQTTWEPNFKEIYGQNVFDDISRNRNSRNIKNTKNINEKNKKLYKDSRGIVEEHKFVPNHPLGTKGIFFTPYEVHRFSDEINSESLYWNLYNEWIKSDRYTYKHLWKQGDICLMDQTLTIHRRPTILKDKPRELLRTACWYKTDLRKHYDYVL